MMQQFDLKPNNSLSRRGRKLALLTFAFVLVLLALRLAAMGFWLVIPFLVVEFLALVMTFAYLRKKSRIHETIIIDDKQLQIQHIEAKKNQSWSFDLHWVKVELQKHTHPWQPSRLLVGSHGKWIQLADFLTDEERTGLLNALNCSINKQLHHV